MHIGQLARRVGNHLIESLFPPTCVLCGAPGTGGQDLCAGCRADLPVNRPCCARCALPFEVALPPGTLCGVCQKRSPTFGHCHAPFRYEGVLPYLVSGGKFHQQLNVLRLCGELLAGSVQEREGVSLPQALVPVPLHPRRMRVRGYNQSLEIARIAGRLLTVPVVPECCERVLRRPPQVGLDRRQRRRNVRGIFRAVAPLPGEHLALVDDVMTTGSTVEECARVLLRAGASRVDVWVVARAP